MFELPEIRRKKPKQAYRKPDAVKELERLAMDEARFKYPTMPHLAPRKYRDDTANGLTKCIVDFLNYSGHQAERINCTGKFIDNTKIITDVLGDSRSIGSVKWLPTSGQKGTSDISAIIFGKSVKIEVKMKDKQSEDQKAYQQQVERAGGKYWICRSLDGFMNYYNELR